jgi:hypothetical protein
MVETREKNELSVGFKYIFNYTKSSRPRCKGIHVLGSLSKIFLPLSSNRTVYNFFVTQNAQSDRVLLRN